MFLILTMANAVLDYVDLECCIWVPSNSITPPVFLSF